MTISPLKKRFLQQVAILNGKYVVRDGRVDFDNASSLGWVYTHARIEGIYPTDTYTVTLLDADKQPVRKQEYAYYGHIELTEIEVTN